MNSRRRAIHLAISAVFLYALWIVLSGHYDPFYLGFGAVAVALVLFLSRGLLTTLDVGSKGERMSSYITLEPWYRMVTFLPWLVVEIIKANWQVACIVVSPKLPIDPVLVEFDAPLPSDVAQVTLAQSITLTPGTVTVDVRGHHYVIHALTPDSAGGLLDGSFQAKVERAFAHAEWEVGARAYGAEMVARPAATTVSEEN